MIKKILTICTGNICRSPIAEVLLQERLSTPQFEILSAGTHALVGRPADKNCFLVMGNRGHLLNKHRAQQLNSELLAWADLILAADDSQLTWVNSLVTYAHGRVFKLSRWDGNQNIPDPYRKSYQDFENAYRLISQAVDGWVARLEKSP